MARINLPVALFFAGASIFCAAGWTSQSLAAWASHAAEGPNDSGAINGTAIGALAPSASPVSSGRGYSNTSNGMPSSLTAPALAPPIGFDRSAKRVRELDGADPWSGESRLRTAGHKKMELEGADPWSPSSIAATDRVGHKRLMLDESDPWSSVGGVPGVAGASATKSSF